MLVGITIRLIPSSSGYLDYAKTDSFADRKPSTIGTTGIVQSYDLSGLKPTRSCIPRVHSHRLYSLGTICLANGSMIKLTM